MAGVNSRYQMNAAITMHENVIRGYMAQQVGNSDARFANIITRVASGPAGQPEYMIGTGDRVLEDPFLPNAFGASSNIIGVITPRGYRIHDFPSFMRVVRVEADSTNAALDSITFYPHMYVAGNVVDESGIAIWRTTA